MCVQFVFLKEKVFLTILTAWLLDGEQVSASNDNAKFLLHKVIFH